MRRKKDVIDDAVVIDEPAVLLTEGPAQPDRESPEWNDFLMSQFGPGETNQEGFPLVHGLRRLFKKFIGRIVKSKPKTIQAPNASNGMHACVEWELYYIDHDDGELVEYGDLADVYIGNTDPMFARFAAATAGTRAEARTLRKALGLKKCSAEELTTMPLAAANLQGMITQDQINVINKTCRDLGISVNEILKEVGNYSKIEHVSFEDGMKMCGILTKRFNGGRA